MHPVIRIGMLSALACLLACGGNGKMGVTELDTASKTLTAPGQPESSTCAVLPALPSVPSNARQVTDFGAVPDDEVADDAAIARALAALAPGEWLVFAPGRYIQASSIYITTPKVTLWGAGARLHASNPADHTLGLRADGVRVYGFELTAVTDERRSAAEQARVSVYRDWTRPGLQRGNVVRGVTIREGDSADLPHSAGSVGILVSAATQFTIAENTVRRTLADGIHLNGGSRNGRIVGNTVRETGDDMIGMVSYLGAGWQQKLLSDSAWRARVEAGETQVSDIVVQGNDLADSYWGRGVAVVGSRNITVLSNRISGTAYGAAVLVAQEGGYDTPGPRNVRIENNQISRVQNTIPPFLPPGTAQADFRARMRAGTLRSGHGAIEVHAVQNAAADLRDPRLFGVLELFGVAVLNNSVRSASTDGVRMGASTAPGLIRAARVSFNNLSQLDGTAVRNLMADPSSARCEGNTLDGATVFANCTLPTDPVASGAAVDCSTLP